MYTNNKIWFGKQMKAISDVSNGHTKSESAIQSFENKINSIDSEIKSLSRVQLSQPHGL